MAELAAFLGIAILVIVAWLAAYAVAVSKASAMFRRARIRRSLDAITGTLLVAFGIRLAAER